MPHPHSSASADELRQRTIKELSSFDNFGYEQAPLKNTDASEMAEDAPRARSQNSCPTKHIIGNSTVMKKLLRIAEKVAPTACAVLITGATGTGKELFARTIHERSLRCNAPFVDVNCSAIPETLFEAELFGFQRGTFTGAHENRRGLFETAAGGTLFLDEVDSLPMSAQSKLLRVLQERHIRRVGGRENIAVDVRVIAATNRDLKASIAQGTMRADLYFRLCVVPIHVPALSERRDDIEPLTEHFLRQHAARRCEPVRRFTTEAMHLLRDYEWTGNVRELENTIEYVLALAEGDVLDVDSLPADVVKGFNGNKDRNAIDELLGRNATLEEVERHYILTMYNRCGRHQIRTAAALGIDRRTLYRKLQQYNIDVD